MNARSAVAGLSNLRARLATPVALRDFGMPETEIGRAAEAVLSVVPVGNPAPLNAENLTTLLRAAWAGTEENPYTHR